MKITFLNKLMIVLSLISCFNSNDQTLVGQKQLLTLLAIS